MREARVAVDRFVAAWRAHDLEATLACCTDDCVFESTGPAPDGGRFFGRDELRAVWQPIFDDRSSRFEVEDTIECDDRVVQRWRYDWGTGHVRGIDVFTVHAGLVSEKLSYVKG